MPYKRVYFTWIYFVFFIQTIIFSQTVSNSKVSIPKEYFIDWTKAGLLPTIRDNFDPVTPTIADNIFIIKSNEDCSEQIQTAIDLAAISYGVSIIYFPEGKYELFKPIVLKVESQQNPSNIIFQGAGSDKTILLFMVGNDGSCFSFQGDVENDFDITQSIEKDDSTFKCNTNFNVGDWIHYHETDFPAEAGTDVGQITQIIHVKNDHFIMKDKSSKKYDIAFGLKVRRIKPITNIGIENLSIERMDTQKSTENAYNSGNNINFKYAVNCWIKGVHLNQTCRMHVAVSRSSHIEISGCYIHHARYYGPNSYGYGVVLGESSTNCLIENNIFRVLRHSIGVGTGANCNVIAYNYSTDRNSTTRFLGMDVPSNDPDICIHGRYSFANLYEQNYIEWIEADVAHGDNGPYNTFLRNKVKKNGTLGTIDLKRTPLAAVVGCEVNQGYGVNGYDPQTSLTFEAYGKLNENWISHNDVESSDKYKYKLSDISYYYLEPPNFLNDLSFPSIGPPVPNRSLPVNDIPARVRYMSNILTYNSSTTIHPDGTEVSVVESERESNQKFVLRAQNFPNPFNPDTNILFELPQTGHVDIRVYDMIGKEITVLFSGNKANGRHSIYWDGRNNLGKQVSSGVYFYKIVFENQMIVKKMIRID